MHQTATQNQASHLSEDLLDVELRKVFKVFNGDTAVRAVELNVQQGEFFSILGPSGCGKTTILRLIAGFEPPSAGEVLIRGQGVNQMPPYRRPVNTVFQSYALFNHMTVRDNVAFGMRIKGHSKSEVESRVQQVLDLVKMQSFANRYPPQLSGGQQQRVALARALVNRPAVLLLDEPLGALDMKLRKEMQMELSNLHRELGVTFIMVTHDQEEALSLSDRIGVMREGKIEQVGSPSEIYEYPQTSFVADFIGETNLLQGRTQHVDRTSLQVVTEAGLSLLVQSEKSWNAGYKQLEVVVSVRPEKVQLSLYPPQVEENCFEGRLRNVMYLGTHVYYVVRLKSGDDITVWQPNTVGELPGEDTPIYVYWAPTDCIALPA